MAWGKQHKAYYFPVLGNIPSKVSRTLQVRTATNGLKAFLAAKKF